MGGRKFVRLDVVYDALVKLTEICRKIAKTQTTPLDYDGHPGFIEQVLSLRIAAVKPFKAIAAELYDLDLTALKHRDATKPVISRLYSIINGRSSLHLLHDPEREVWLLPNEICAADATEDSLARVAGVDASKAADALEQVRKGIEPEYLSICDVWGEVVHPEDDRPDFRPINGQREADCVGQVGSDETSTEGSATIRQASHSKRENTLLEVRGWAESRLKGLEKAAILLLCDRNGASPLADIVVCQRWSKFDDNKVNSLKTRLNKKLREDKVGFDLKRHDNSLRLTPCVVRRLVRTRKVQ